MMVVEVRKLDHVWFWGLFFGGVGDGIIVLSSNAIVKMVAEEFEWYKCVIREGRIRRKCA